MSERHQKWYPCKIDPYGYLNVHDDDRDFIFVSATSLNTTTSEMDEYSITLPPACARAVANEIMKRADALEGK